MIEILRVLAEYKVDINTLPKVAADDNGVKFQAIMTVAFIVIGAISVLFLTIGGFRYVASQGDSQAAAQAKNTIMYSLVGLLVSVTAVALVTFVLDLL